MNPQDNFQDSSSNRSPFENGGNPPPPPFSDSQAPNDGSRAQSGFRPQSGGIPPYFQGPLPFAFPNQPRPKGFGDLVKAIFTACFGITALGCFALFLLTVLAIVGLFAIASSTGDSEQIVAETVLSGANTASKKIAILPISGTITEDENGFIRQAIKKAYEDDKVAGLILRINSPGGTIAGSDYYYHLLRELKAERKIPIYVSMGSVAASGGYYVAMTGDKIFAERSTITGSIGVIGMLFDAHKLCKKIGVSSNFITSGPNKGMGDVTKPMSSAERAIWQGLIDESYAQFLEVVREGRPRFALKDPTADSANADDSANDSDDAHDDEEAENQDESQTAAGQDSQDEENQDASFFAADDKTDDNEDAQNDDSSVPAKTLEEIADGRIYSAAEAFQLGLIDEIGFLQDAVLAMKDEIKVSDANLQVIRYQKPKSLVDLLASESEETEGKASVQAALTRLSSPGLFYLPPGYLPLDADSL